MNFKNLCIVNGIVCLLFGLQLLIIPASLGGFYLLEGESLTEISLFIGRLYGAVLMGLGIGFVISTKAQASYARRGILTIITVGNILGTIVHIYGILQGIENNMGWSTVVLLIVLAVWGGMLLSKETKLIKA